MTSQKPAPKHTSISIPKPLHKAARLAAAEDDVTLAAWIRALMITALENRKASNDK